MSITTKQRQIILDTIRESPDHMTAEQIYIKSKKKLPSIAVGTVYRNLSILTEEKQIRKIDFADSPDRYDKNLFPHEHMICDCCQKVSDVTIENLDSIIKEKTSGTLISYELTIHYICKDCKNSKH